MWLKLHLDTGHCFSTKIVPNIGVSVSPLENIHPLTKQHRLLHTPNSKNGLSKRPLGEAQRHTCDGTNRRSVDNPRRETRDLVKSDGFSDDSNGGGPYFSSRKLHSKCSTKFLNRDGSEARGAVQNPRRGTAGEKISGGGSKKWSSYGGCIPAILQALDETKDLNEALKPWEERLNNKERSIILKEQPSWERALEIFEWFESKGCHELNVIHYNILLRTLGRAREWRHVDNLWDAMCLRGIAPINSTYGTLIDVYSKAGLKREALCWLARMNKQGISPDEVTMGIVVQLYKKSGEFRKAEDFFKKWSRNDETALSSHSYNTLIDTYGKAGRLREASDTFSRMLSQGIAPTTVTFNTMIHICGNNGRLEEVASLIEKMDELRCPPETRTFNILISLHAKHDDIETASSFFAKMKEASLEPDIVSYRTLLYAYSIRRMVSEAEALISEMDSKGLEIDEFTQSALTRMYIESGELEKSWLWFRRFHLKGNMSSECYSANIDAYGERGFVSEAESVFLCARESDERRPPGVVEFNVMIKAYGIGRWYAEACTLLDTMDLRGVAPDKCSYSSLVHILANADLANEARGCLEKMKASGFVTDCIPYCAVMSSFAKLGDSEAVESLYNEMIGNGIEPDIIVFGILINAFAEFGSVEKALFYVDQMKGLGLTGDEIIHKSLIKLYTKFGMLLEAQGTYELLESPDVFSSNCMIDLYSERSMVGPAKRVFESLRRDGSVNEFTLAMMMCLYKKIGRFEEAIAIAGQMRESRVLTDPLSFNNAIGLYAMCGRFKEAVATFEEMLESSVPPDDCTFKSLGVVLVKLGVSKRVVAELEVSAKRDPRAGVARWVSALSSVVRVGDCGDL